MCLNNCFGSSKKSGKGKRPGKGGNRFHKSIGLGFKTPREAIEGFISLLILIYWNDHHSIDVDLIS